MDLNRTIQQLPEGMKNLFSKCNFNGNSLTERKKEDSSFRFPPPPPLPPNFAHFSPPPWCNNRLDDLDTSDSQQSEQASKTIRRQHNHYSTRPGTRGLSGKLFRGYQSDGSPARFLPPIGVFWDIENCQIPRGRSAVAVAQAIRDKFFYGYQEAEFLVVCDVKKESCQVVQELNDAQVNLIHVGSTSKNAADEKLRHSMRRFADIHGFPAAIVLISGDINFAPDLCDLRHRKKIHIILVHNEVCSETLILCANEHYSFSELVDQLPLRGYVKTANQQPAEILVSNLPRGSDFKKIRKRLRSLSENCGGRVGYISATTANIRFPSVEYAIRAQKRLDGELVFGNQISVSLPQRIYHRNDLKLNGHGDGFISQNQSIIGSENAFHPLNNPWFSSCWNGSNIEPNSISKTCGNVIQRPQPTIGGINKKMGIQSNISNQTAWDQAPWIWQYSNEENGSQNLGNPKLTNRSDNSEGYLKNAETISKRPSVIHPLISSTSGHEFNNSKRVESILKQSNVSSKPSRRTLDSMHIPHKNTAITSFSRKCRTPSPYMMPTNNHLEYENLNLPSKTMSFSEESLENEKFFHPIQSGSFENIPVVLLVTNLDQNIGRMELQNILFLLFSEHVLVLHISVFTQTDGVLVGNVKVKSLQDAQLAISKLHRKKIGYKRIMISYSRSTQPQNLQIVRWQVISLLQEVPDHKLPLFKFIELYESRYIASVSVSDLHRLKGVCFITDESIGRMISLNSEYRCTPSPNLIPTQDIEPFCSLHFKGNRFLNKGWAEQEAVPLPNVMEPLPTFTSFINKLLASHNNILPLVSLCDCYEAICGRLNVYENGVPLEHYVTCVPNVELALTDGIKYLKAILNPSRSDKKEDVVKSMSPPLLEQLNLLGRELIDLLKQQPHCQLLFSKFIPAFHHHFGRQCRVADYGFTKLIDLLEAMPKVVQVIGEGNKRIVTLTHRAQVRRFTSELLRVLKTQPHKKMNLSELSQLFERVLTRPFDTVNYGLCRLEDLISQISENIVVITESGDEVTIAIPKREQTFQEMGRLKQFSKEVIELLSLAPQYCVLFNRFIPAYHHHFGHQCRLADFGFSKLIELFEGMPDIVELDEDGEGERRVKLTLKQRVKVLSDQILELVMMRYPPELLLSSLPSAYLWQFGYSLKSENYEKETLQELVVSINTVELVNLESGLTIVPAGQAEVKKLVIHTIHLLLDSPNGKLTLSDLRSSFDKRLQPYFIREQISSLLKEFVEIEEATFGSDVYVILNSLYQFVQKAYKLLLKSEEWKLSLSALEQKYLTIYSVPIQPSLYGFSSIASLITAVPFVLTLKGKRLKRMVILNKDFIPCQTLEESTQRSSTNSASDEELESNDVPVVNLPELTAPPENIIYTSDLISPCKNLLPANTNSFHSKPFVMAPDPSELPIPKQYLSPLYEKVEELGQKRALNDHSSKTAKKLVTDEQQTDLNCHCVERDTPDSSCKRKPRLAAHFKVPFESPV